MAASKRSKKTTKKRPSESGGLSTSLLVRLAPELMERIDAHVQAKQTDRPGWSRSDFVREAIVKALREQGEAP